jgi:hypothetical protein
MTHWNVPKENNYLADDGKTTMQRIPSHTGMVIMENEMSLHNSN